MELESARLAYSNGNIVEAFKIYIALYNNYKSLLTIEDQLTLEKLANKFGQDKFLTDYLEDRVKSNPSMLWLAKLYRQYKKTGDLNEDKTKKISNILKSVNTQILDGGEKYKYSMLKFLINEEYKSEYLESIKTLKMEIGSKKIKNKFNPDIALKSTLELINELEKRLGENPFLIGGTLLGIIRNGQLLSHDKDTDIGVHFSKNTNYFKIAQEIAYSTKFKVPKIYSDFYINRSNIITFVDQENLVTIDLFLFKNDGNNIYQEIELLSGPIRWNYSDFETSKIRVKNNIFSVPDNPEDFIASNFGDDWRVSKESWDSLINCPNIPISCHKSMAYVSLKKYYEELKNGNVNKSKIYEKFIMENKLL